MFISKKTYPKLPLLGKLRTVLFLWYHCRIPRQWRTHLEGRACANQRPHGGAAKRIVRSSRPSNLTEYKRREEGFHCSTDSSNTVVNTDWFVQCSGRYRPLCFNLVDTDQFKLSVQRLTGSPALKSLWSIRSVLVTVVPILTESDKYNAD